MSDQLNFFNQPSEVALYGSALGETVQDIRSRGGFVAGVKCGPRNGDYTLRILWNVEMTAFEPRIRKVNPDSAAERCRKLNELNQRRKEPELI